MITPQAQAAMGREKSANPPDGGTESFAYEGMAARPFVGEEF